MEHILSYLEKINKLVDGSTLGDRRPSRKCSVTWVNFPEVAITILWSMLLPTNVRFAFSLVTDNLEESGKLVDPAYKLTKDTQEISAATATTSAMAKTVVISRTKDRDED